MSLILNNSVSSQNFSEIYPFINRHIIENGDSVSSRNGDTKEILNFKTEIKNPYERCVGNNNRNINIFFLLAEAIWIFAGKKDLKFLKIFNDRMSDYSDDGEVFHAPYGFRIRHHGVASNLKISPSSEEQNHHINQLYEGTDQLVESLKMLSGDPDSRRVVISIWNADLDLNSKSKDLPCNDLIMFKIRNGKLHTTISNRSNDLHWGLTTNVFQFSFISEIMSNILNLKLGTQVHNSQSLHVYLENDLTKSLFENMIITENKFTDLYSFSSPLMIDMDLGNGDIDSKISKIDYFLNLIIKSLTDGKELHQQEQENLGRFSSFLLFSYNLLQIYCHYKFNPIPKTDDMKSEFYLKIKNDFQAFEGTDIYSLALNYFASRFKTEKYQTKFGLIGSL